MPAFVGNALEPFLGVLGDTHRRRTLLLAGGVGVALSAALTSAAAGFWWLLVALCIGYPAATAFVSLAQASLMDFEPERRERNMARWALAGSAGVVAGPFLLAVAVWAGGGWRVVPAVLAVVALALTLAARRAPVRGGAGGESLLRGLVGAAAALRRREVLRWLGVLEASDLMLDVFHGFLALYFVEVAGLGGVEAGLALGVWTGGGLAGDALLLLVLRFVPGVRYLRLSALAVAAVYPAFLLVDTLEVKLTLVALLGLLNSGWYAIPKAGLYQALPGRSGTAIAVGSVGGFVGAVVPLTLGLLAEAVGLGAAMWALILAPAALLVLLPRQGPY